MVFEGYKKIIIFVMVVAMTVTGLSACGSRATGSDVSADVVSSQVVSEPIQNIPGMLVNCDSTAGMSVDSYNDDFGVTDEQDTYKEGTGAFQTIGREAVWWQIVLDNPIDISAYADGGLHLWLYISELTKLNADVKIELGSAGKGGVNNLKWIMASEKLTDGWNELVVKFANAEKSEDGGADLSHINYLRIYNSTNEGVTVRLDDVRAVEVEHKTVSILNCDSADSITVTNDQKDFSVTTAAGEHKEGKGAFKIVQKDKVMMAIRLEKPVDASDCEDGYVHFWLWFSDVSLLNESVRIELASGGIYDKEECQWTLEKEKFVNGWNEINLQLSKASRSGDGGLDASRINWFRIYSLKSGSITTIVDDVCLAN